MNLHEKYMRRCLELAKNGLPASMPNPSVGAVIVLENKIIGEGYTSPYGGSHAEVNAINSVKDKSLLNKATIYVSLEPCSHFGKTPPCCDLISKHKIPNVVIGVVDTNSKVSGNGIKKLIESGTNVTVGVLEKECYESNRRFFTFHEKKRPYVILKWAESQNGFISPKTKKVQKPIWISNSYSRQLVHKWRSEEQAILVGTNTIIEDNPKLDVRDWAGENPLRVIIDQNNRVKTTSHVLDNKIKTIVFCKSPPTHNLENCTFVSIDFEQNLAQQILSILFQIQIQSIIIEGGKQTLQTFIDANLWDEARIFIGTKLIVSGTKAPEIAIKNIEKHSIIQDQLLIIRNHD